MSDAGARPAAGQRQAPIGPGAPDRPALRVGVIGLGHIGLPLAVAAATAGDQVLGIDRNPEVVAAVSRGCSPVDTVSAAELLAAADRLTVGYGDQPLAGCTVVVVCTPTPLDSAGRPDLDALRSATELVADQLRPGQLVIIESSTAPGTTEDVLLPLLERSGLTGGLDFNLAYSPERVDPANPTFGWSDIPKVVGGLTPTCAKRAADFYQPLVPSIHLTRSCREAEAAKMLENAFRQVNIALVNEFARVCRALGLDVWEVLAAASTKPFGFLPFRPGPGVGGHCIPVDPLYLAAVAREAGQACTLIESAQRINDAMPAWVVERVLQECAGRTEGRSPRVLLAGITYKPNVHDLRNSPAIPIVTALRRHGAEVAYHDPLAGCWSVDDEPVRRIEDLGLDPLSDGFDIVVLLQRHRELDVLRLAELGPIFDTTGTVEGADVGRL